MRLSSERSFGNVATVASRDPERKRAQLVEAALVEFAIRGFSGTTVDAIASRAGCSTGLIYTHFGSKEGLFHAVLDAIAEHATQELPITPEDLPGYAVRLYDANLARPEVLRFVAWYQLEREQLGRRDEDGTTRAMREKITAVQSAQKRGSLPEHFDAGELVLTVQTIALMWLTSTSEVANAITSPEDQERRRRVIVDAVTRLLSGQPAAPDVSARED